MPGIYIHIPFCVKKCRYCAFHSIPYSSELVSQYIKSLTKEVKRRKDRWKTKFDTLYLGGGTPSLLGTSELDEILNAVFANFDLALKEFTIEVNPGTIDIKKFLYYKSKGINRISIGVQSLNEAELSYLGRIHKRDDAVRCVKDARYAGFENISIDLIYGIPIQKRDSWGATLEGVKTLEPAHISAYSLSYEPETPMCKEIPMESKKEEVLYYDMLKYLKKKGYKQ